MQYNTTSCLVKGFTDSSDESQEIAEKLAKMMLEADSHPEERSDFANSAAHLLADYGVKTRKC